MRAAGLAVLALVACGSGNKKTDAPVEQPKDAAATDAPPLTDAPMTDAPVLPDAPTAVQVVSCTGVTPDATIVTESTVFMYEPDTATVPANGIVKFVMAGNHNVTPDTTMSDDGLHVAYGQTRCLKFTTAGTFGFHCVPHLFTGKVTVTP